MTVNDLIKALKTYARTSPENGFAEVVLRDVDGETLFHFGKALDGHGMPGQHFLIFVPQPQNSFKMKEAMKI